MSKRLVLMCAAVAAGLSLTTAATAVPVIDGFKVEPYVFDDFFLSTLVVTNSFPDVKFEEGPWGTNFGGFANRHDALLSEDGGMTARPWNGTEGWDISVNVKVEAGADSPRKEGGIRVNSNMTGPGLFIVNTNGHEIVAFGGPFPFFSFNATYGAPFLYDNGDTIKMRMIYRPGLPTPSELNPSTIQYIVDAGTGPAASPILPFTNLEHGVLDGSQIALYAQGAPNNVVTDFDNTTFTGFSIQDPITFVPGDVNFDGTVNIFDINLVSAHWGETGPIGNANGIAPVDIFDINLISANWTVGGPSGANAIPEPSTALLVGSGLFCLVAGLRARAALTDVSRLR